MTDTTPPPIGSMYLWDAIEPPLPAGRYKLTSTAAARFATSTEQLGRDHLFTVDAPRFTLPPGEVAGTVPPRNGHGAFHESLPHVVLGRRTLPWERSLSASHADTPWLALLLFEEDECTFLDQQPLENVVPADVFVRLGRPQGVLCDAVEVDHDLLADVIPSVEEVTLLTHVRQVNVDDRELSAGDSDGWFAIVVANRLPAPGRTNVACLVSLEERIDVVPEEPPPVEPPVRGGGRRVEVEAGFVPDADQPERDAFKTGGGGAEEGDTLAAFRGVLSEARNESLLLPPSVELVGHAGLGGAVDLGDLTDVLGGIEGVFERRDRLVLLHRWKFDDNGSATFKELMQALDVGMIGQVAVSGRPVVADTGHIPLTVHDRSGALETAWYRGPLVPDQLSRDELGPYHSADQARRLVPETQSEDVSYAAAFEVGRLLAAADQRLGVELMRWRRGAYRTAAHRGVIQLVRSRLEAVLPGELLDMLPEAIMPVVAQGAIDGVTRNIGPVGDPYRHDLVAGAPGLDPALVQAAWRLPSAADAARLLDGAVLGADVGPVAQAAVFGSVDEAMQDAAGMERLDAARAAAFEEGGV